MPLSFFLRLFILILLYTGKTITAQTNQTFITYKNSVAIYPSYNLLGFYDSLGNYNKTSIIDIQSLYFNKLYNTFYLGLGFNYSVSKGNFVNNGRGLGVSAGIKKYWHIEVYNKKCKPVNNNFFYFSSILLFNFKSYIYNIAQRNVNYTTGLNYFNISVHPLSIEASLTPKIKLNYSKEFTFYELSFQTTSRNALGVVYYFNL